MSVSDALNNLSDLKNETPHEFLLSKAARLRQQADFQKGSAERHRKEMVQYLENAADYESQARSCEEAAQYLRENGQTDSQQPANVVKLGGKNGR